MAASNPLPVLGSVSAFEEAFSGSPTTREERSGEENFRVSIPTFDGPLDLLLHLIRRDQVNIYDIPIARICESYLSYLDLMQNPDVNLAGEFMVMASTLIYLKSAMLLPSETEEGEDPRLPLVARLLEYEAFQRAAQAMDRRPWLYRDNFARPEASSRDLFPEEALATAPIDPVEAFALLVALKTALDRSTRTPIQIAIDTTSLKEKVSEIRVLLERDEITNFRACLPDRPKKNEIIVTFIAMLELARLKFIEILQPEILGPIQMRRVRNFEELNESLLQQF